MSSIKMNICFNLFYPWLKGSTNFPNVKYSKRAWNLINLFLMTVIYWAFHQFQHPSYGISGFERNSDVFLFQYLGNFICHTLYIRESFAVMS